MLTSFGLPLLIANGKLQSLDSMSVKEMEKFIPFMTNCSINKCGATVINEIPAWWTSSIPYKFPLEKPSGLSLEQYRNHLASIVCKCYWYHDYQFLLGICSDLANNPESIFIKNNDEDNTTSIFYKKNSALILKFNNENKNYENMPPFRGRSPRPHYLRPLPDTAAIPDIYLCETCDSEFASHKEIQEHEKICLGTGLSTNLEENNDDHEIINNQNHEEDDNKTLNHSGSSASVVELESSIHLFEEQRKKNSFFSNLNLNPCNDNSITTSKLKKRVRKSGSKQFFKSDLVLEKNRCVEFSSLSGRKSMGNILTSFGKRIAFSKIQKSIRLYESHCSLKTHSNHEEGLDFKVTYKGKENCWAHQYSFGKRQRESRYKTLQTGLDEDSRKLLKSCKMLSIVLTQLKLPK